MPPDNMTDHDMLVKLYTAVIGTNGTEGCWIREKQLSADFYKFRRYAMVLIAFLSGAGGFSIAKVFDLLQ